MDEARGGEMMERNEIEKGSESTPSSKFHKLPRTESIRLVSEPIRFYPDFKINVQNALRIDSQSILMRIVLNREPRYRGACGANDSAYGDSGPSGVVSAVGSLFPRGTKANVAAYGSGRGPPANDLATNLELGTVGLREREGRLNSWFGALPVLRIHGLGILTPYIIRLFRYRFKLGKLAKHPWNSESLAFSEGQVFRCMSWRTRGVSV
ncbi:hypothetical protein PIB30_019633 [Stylosanthes scabra]|uniref:Uncharacterized protein n=1 Tax=Stylosanthes scabra TaxID=79078 RepID=A0ABU6R8L1_9FABA|nr:hypothetical protein [Stylosanthes scabra]